MLQCLGAGWHPEIGDPTIFGWITVVAYLVTALLAVLVWSRRTEPTLRKFWAFTALLLGFLAVNKQLDLQTGMTDTGRCLFNLWGIYNQRSFAQLLFIIVMVALVFLFYIRAARAMRRYRGHRLAMLGLGFVAAFVLIRATSFHAVDLIGSTQFYGVSANVLLENFGLVLITLNAIGLLSGRIQARPARREPPAPPRRAAEPVRPAPDAGVAEARRPSTAAPRFPVEPTNH